MAFIGLPWPMKRTGMRSVFSPCEYVLFISLISITTANFIYKPRIYKKNSLIFRQMDFSRLDAISGSKTGSVMLKFIIFVKAYNHNKEYNEILSGEIV
jgi:hypothetical protein